MTTPNQWVNAAPLFPTTKPAHVAAAEQDRLQAYGVYDNMYWNVPDTFKLVWRGTPNDPIYIPNAKVIVETCNRFLGVGFDFIVMNDDPSKLTQRTLDALFRRERFFSKYKTQKRSGLIRGDAVWHIVGDPSKPAGRRISIYEVDPRRYFPIPSPDDPEKVVGCFIITLLADPKNGTSQIVKRQKYMRVLDASGNATVTSEINYYELNKWDDRIDPNTLKPYQDGVVPISRKGLEAVKAFVVPGITALPVYHIKNQRVGGSSYGNSEIRGLERLAAAPNQAVSDQELALALDGLGLYFTTSGPPKNTKGEPTNWVLGPGRVVEGDAQSTFQRVNGVGQVSPFLDHIAYIEGKMQQSSGIPDLAVGRVDVAVAESGIALAFKMAPLLAANAEKEEELLGVYDNMFYDLVTEWLPQYETYAKPDTLDIVPKTGDPMPVDRAAVIAEVVQMLSTVPPIITVKEAQNILTERLGYTFSDSELSQIVAQEAELSVARDPFSQRLNAEDQDDPTLPPGSGSPANE